jgi:hypothetical protein
LPTETWVEQFGRVIVEAQASGTVAAGYASGSIPEVSGHAGVLTAVGDAAALANAVSALFRDPVGYEQRRRAGLAASIERTWASVADRQASLYRRVLAGDVARLEQPRSPSRRRTAARAEFGPTAATTAGERPFALPLLRHGGAPATVLAAGLDAIGELWVRLPAPRRAG